MVFLTSVVCLTQDKLNGDYVSVYMNINLKSDIKKPTKLALLNTAGKITKLLILILLKSFADPILHLNLTSLKLSISTKIKITYLSVVLASLLYQIGKLTLILISPDPSFSFWFYKCHTLLLSYWSISFISGNSIVSYSLRLDPLIYYT